MHRKNSRDRGTREVYDWGNLEEGRGKYQHEECSACVCVERWDIQACKGVVKIRSEVMPNNFFGVLYLNPTTHVGFC